jgi:hypothetical protein
MLLFPPNLTTFRDRQGNTVVADKSRRCAVDPSDVVLADFLLAGFVLHSNVAGSIRPTSTYPGQPFYDMTLDQPIWRNAANTAWNDTTGNPV